jgi:hypothetical protein
MTHHDTLDGGNVEDVALERLLRAYDVAPSDTAPLRGRIDARLARVIVEEDATPPLAPATSRRRRTAARVAGLVAAAAAAALTLTLLPGPGDGHAYASWTPTAQAVAERDGETAVQECRAALRGPFWARHDGGPEEFDPQAATVALTERRGDLVSVLLRDEGPLKGLSAFCVVTLKEGATSGEVKGHGVGGAVGGPPALAPDDGFLEGSMSQSGQQPISMLDGAVGRDVAALTIHAGELTVEATIQGGRYAAWIPGRIFSVQDPGPGGQGGPEPILTYDLTLSDGRVVADARPAAP